MEKDSDVRVKELLSVSFNEDTGSYLVNVAKGSNVNETAFGVSVIIKCFKRDGFIKDSKEFIDLIKKYLDDPQYDELVKEEKNAQN